MCFLGPGGSAPISIDGNNRLLSVSQENGTINLWEIQTGNKIRTLRHDGQVMAMAPATMGIALSVRQGRESDLFGFGTQAPVN